MKTNIEVKNMLYINSTACGWRIIVSKNWTADSKLMVVIGNIANFTVSIATGPSYETAKLTKGNVSANSEFKLNIN